MEKDDHENFTDIILSFEVIMKEKKKIRRQIFRVGSPYYPEKIWKIRFTEKKKYSPSLLRFNLDRISFTGHCKIHQEQKPVKLALT